MSVLKQTEKIRSIVVSVLCRKIAGFSPSRCLHGALYRKENNLTRVLLTEIFTNGPLFSNISLLQRGTAKPFRYLP